MHGLHVFCLCFLWFVIILGELTNVVCEQLINLNTELGDILSERSQSKISTSSVEHDPQPEKDLLNTDADCDLRENKNSPEAHITAHKSKLSFAPCLCKMHGISIDLKQISRESFFGRERKDIYTIDIKLSILYFQWLKVMVYHKMPLTLVYHTYFESKTEILVSWNTFIDSNERVFWVKSLCLKNAKLWCWE